MDDVRSSIVHCPSSIVTFTFHARFGTITSMSTPRRIDPKTASKRRAARRKRTRETLGRIGVLGIVAILVISTISTVILPTTVTAPIAPTATVAAGIPTPTQANFSAIVTQADDAASKGNWNDAASLYRAYLAQDADNGEVHFKLGKVYLSMQPPNYLDGLAELQQALNINPGAPYAQEAQSLIDQHKDKALTPVTTVGSGTEVPGTITPVITVTGSGTVTSTTVVTGTSVTGTAPPATTPAGATPTP
ncbi:MAG: tetratricopeptide repeat protein [Chloroflexota bacterium]|nr:tetratricopeptide repeat protein [Chloroflexota bacterium]